jgi:transcriptional regulator with XRE-family HTH domain
MSEIGDRLREERERLGLNQQDFGALGGVARNAQSRYEKGERAPDTDYLEALRQSGVDIVYVLIGTRLGASGSELPPDEAELIEAFRECTEEGRKHLVAAGQAFKALAPTYQSVDVNGVVKLHAAEDEGNFGS